MNPLFLINKYGRQVTAGEVKVLFGLKPTDPWPAEGMPKRTIQGFICWVDPLVVTPTSLEQMARGTPAKRVPFRLRARFFCGVCGDEVPIGRGEQHASRYKNRER